MPAFHALLPVRDEADILPQCLDHLLKWADAVYVFDTGSVDESWDIVNDYARTDSRIKALRQDHVYYSENLLRGWLFHQARQNMRDGDWFLRVDADEFHHIPPPEFVKTRLRKSETIAWHQYYNFCLLESEAAQLGTVESVCKERALPIEKRRTRWLPSVYAEPRLCRYRESMKWPSSRSFPYNSGFVALERLPIRHYPHRDPIQLERRCLLRSVMMADKNISGKYWTAVEQHHWAEQEWRQFVTADTQEGLYEWSPGAVLPELKLTNHLSKPAVRAAQYMLQRFGVRFTDQLRPGWDEQNYPESLPPHLIEQLQISLRRDIRRV